MIKSKDIKELAKLIVVFLVLMILTDILLNLIINLATPSHIIKREDSIVFKEEQDAKLQTKNIEAQSGISLEEACFQAIVYDCDNQYNLILEADGFSCPRWWVNRSLMNTPQHIASFPPITLIYDSFEKYHSSAGYKKALYNNWAEEDLTYTKYYRLDSDWGRQTTVHFNREIFEDPQKEFGLTYHYSVSDGLEACALWKNVPMDGYEIDDPEFESFDANTPYYIMGKDLVQVGDYTFARLGTVREHLKHGGGKTRSDWLFRYYRISVVPLNVSPVINQQLEELEIRDADRKLRGAEVLKVEEREVAGRNTRVYSFIIAIILFAFYSNIKNKRASR